MGTGVLCQGGVEVGQAGPVHGWWGQAGGGGWLVARGGSKVAWG